MFTMVAAAVLRAHDRAGGVRAGDGPLEVDGQQHVELVLPVPAGLLAREHVGTGVVDPDVEAAELLFGLRHQLLAAGAGAQVRLGHERAVPDPPRDRRRILRAVAVGHQHGGALAAERLGDGGADAAARARDDGSHPLEPATARLRLLSHEPADYTMPPMPVKQVQRRSSTATVAGAAQLACVLEASAEKPGNITPHHDFGDTSYEDMLRSGIALGPELGRAGERGVGATVLASVQASRGVAGANTNLGIALLLAPLARAELGGEPVRDVLRALTVDDARNAYAAIRMAGAGGLDDPVEHDVRDEPRVTLREAMAAAAERDTIAAEYAGDFPVTFELGLPALRAALGAGLGARPAIVELALRVLAEVPDTLIARKRGPGAAARVAAEAGRVLAAGGVRSVSGKIALAAFDASLRSEDNALNPGTTADLVTAVLFVALLEGLL